MCHGIPGQIVAIEDAEAMLATVDVSGVKRRVDLTCVAPEAESLDALIGRWVLVHVGFAMSVIDEAEAEATLALLAELGELEAEQEALRTGTVA